MEAEDERRRRNRGGGAADGGEEGEMIASMQGVRARLPGGGGRGEHGGPFAPARSAPGGLYRRRCAAAARSSLGHGAALGLGFCRRGKKEGRRSSKSRACFLTSTGARAREGASRTVASARSLQPWSLQGEDDDRFLKNPLAVISLFCF